MPIRRIFAVMGHKKLVRFQAIHSFSNVLQYPVGMSGKWNEVFSNKNPITLELACGRGEYTVGLSALYPDRNVIGIDIKGNRLYSGALRALNENLRNAAFLRIQIDKLDTYFAKSEIDEIWITFPDPHLRTSRAKKRLTHPRFLRLYQSVLKPNGRVHLKTDSPDLYYFTKLIADLYNLEILDFSEDVYSRPENLPEMQIKTHYEKLDIADSKQVFYIQLTLPESSIPVSDRQLQELLKRMEKKNQPDACK